MHKKMGRIICLLGLLALLCCATMLNICCAEGSFLWLKRSEMKYARDGSAYCDVTIMKEQEPLSIEECEIVAAQCFLKNRRKDKGILLALKPRIVQNRINFLVSSPQNSACNLIVKLEHANELYVLQTDFNLYGTYTEASSVIGSRIPLEEAIKPSMSIISRGNLQMGRPIHFTYNPMWEEQRESGQALQARVYSAENKLEHNLTLDERNSGSFRLKKLPELTVHPSYRTDRHYLHVRDEANGKRINTLYTMEVYSSRYAYLNIKHGVILFSVIAVLSIFGFMYLLRRNLNVY